MGESYSAVWGGFIDRSSSSRHFPSQHISLIAGSQTPDLGIVAPFVPYIVCGPTFGVRHGAAHLCYFQSTLPLCQSTAVWHSLGNRPAFDSKYAQLVNASAVNP